MSAASILMAVAVTWFPGAAYDVTCTLGRVDRATTTSETCLSCHDGSTAPAVALHAVANGAHPVGVSYALARPESSLRRYGPTSARLVLPRGRVECVTCHAIDGRGPHWTVSPADLCTACHDL